LRKTFTDVSDVVKQSTKHRVTTCLKKLERAEN